MSAWTAEDGHPTTHYYSFVHTHSRRRPGYYRSDWVPRGMLTPPGAHVEWHWRIDAISYGGDSHWQEWREGGPDPLAHHGFAPTEKAARDACNTAVATMVLSGLVRPL